MQLTISNLKVFKHGDDYALKLMMPDGSDNYLHTETNDLESILINRSLLLEQEIDETQIKIKETDKYYRLYLNLQDVNGELHIFHSRKLNLNDVIFERDLLLDFMLSTKEGER